jgi:hypothetical protein
MLIFRQFMMHAGARRFAVRSARRNYAMRAQQADTPNADAQRRPALRRYNGTVLMMRVAIFDYLHHLRVFILRHRHAATMPAETDLARVPAAMTVIDARKPCRARHFLDAARTR